MQLGDFRRVRPILFHLRRLISFWIGSCLVEIHCLGQEFVPNFVRISGLIKKFPIQGIEVRGKKNGLSSSR